MPSAPLPTLPRPARQRGIYALEWAIIFPVFFVLLYAIISYGLAFLVRESMQFAVEEGARAALRYPSSAVLGGASAPTWAHRRTEAQQTTVQALGWLPANLRPDNADVQFAVCRVSDTSCTPASPLNTGLVCDINTPCLVLVAYRISNYPMSAIAPSIPGLGLLLPDTLHAQASVMVDRRVL